MQKCLVFMYTFNWLSLILIWVKEGGKACYGVVPGLKPVRVWCLALRQVAQSEMDPQAPTLRHAEDFTAS